MLQVITIAALCIDAEHIMRMWLGDPHYFMYNYGMAFSTFQNRPVMSTVITSIATVMIGIAAFHLNNDTCDRVSYSLMLGGALSNLTEKLILGYVIDWIKVPFIPLVINIADIEITLGVIISSVSFFFEPIIKLPR